MAQTRYDITWHHPDDDEATTDFKLTPKAIVDILRWSLVKDTGTFEKNPVKIWAISKCAE